MQLQILLYGAHTTKGTTEPLSCRNGYSSQEVCNGFFMLKYQIIVWNKLSNKDNYASGLRARRHIKMDDQFFNCFSTRIQSKSLSIKGIIYMLSQHILSVFPLVPKATLSVTASTNQTNNVKSVMASFFLSFISSVVSERSEVSRNIFSTVNCSEIDVASTSSFHSTQLLFYTCLLA